MAEADGHGDGTSAMKEGREELRDIAGALRQALLLERGYGAAEVPKAPPPPELSPEARLALLERTAAQASGCVKCALHAGRKSVVFGSGAPGARLMFVGEGPGADEDEQGLPFVGRAGQLLTKMIEAMGMKREEVYICNVVKCRPPGNRTPEPVEIAACSPYLKAQIAAVRPAVICALGSPAARTLLRTATSISALRGAFHEHEGIPVMPTFHPAYLLRNPSEKAKVWSDLKKVRDLLKAPPEV